MIYKILKRKEKIQTEGNEKLQNFSIIIKLRLGNEERNSGGGLSKNVI